MFVIVNIYINIVLKKNIILIFKYFDHHNQLKFLFKIFIVKNVKFNFKFFIKKKKFYSILLILDC